MLLKLSLLAGLVMCACASTAWTKDKDPAEVARLLKMYPCGPDSLTGPLRKLIPQGAYGADFKPACRAHDACYDTPYANRDACDAKFRENMVCACSESKHPICCRIIARIIARNTHRFGEEAFASAQKIALEKSQCENTEAPCE